MLCTCRAAWDAQRGVTTYNAMQRYVKLVDTLFEDFSPDDTEESKEDNTIVEAPVTSTLAGAQAQQPRQVRVAYRRMRLLRCVLSRAIF